jgi:hypothetical protein
MKRYASIALIVIIVYIVWAFLNRAEAATATVSWTNPTQRVDNSPLAPTDIGKSYVEWGTCGAGGAFGSFVGSKESPGAATSLVTPDLPVGTYCFRVFTVTTTGLSSGPSAVVSKVVTPPESPPKPPAITTIAQTAWVLKPSWWGLVRLAQVDGVTLQLGAPCSAMIPGMPGYGISGNYIAKCA